LDRLLILKEDKKVFDTPEYKLKKSIYTSEAWKNNPERKQKVSDTLKKYNDDPVVRKQKSIIQKQLWEEKDGYRENISQKLKLKWKNDEEYRKKCSAKHGA